MPVFRWGHNWNAFDDLEREVDRLLKSVNLTFQGLRLGRQYPAINFYELPDEFLLTAELPGTRADEIELTIAGDVLTIAGERLAPADVPETAFRRQERPHGQWKRSVSVPDRVRSDELSAEFNNGVLKVHLPKAAQPEARQIPVAGGSEWGQ